jgi:hypothetical protein
MMNIFIKDAAAAWFAGGGWSCALGRGGLDQVQIEKQ